MEAACTNSLVLVEVVYAHPLVIIVCAHPLLLVEVVCAHAVLLGEFVCANCFSRSIVLNFICGPMPGRAFWYTWLFHSPDPALLYIII